MIMAEVGTDELAEFLDKVADSLEKYGWIQDDAGSVTRGFCAVGAINATALNSEYWGHHSWSQILFPAQAALADYLRAEGVFDQPMWIDGASSDLARHKKNLIVNWNDHPDRTASDVTMALRKAALGLREQA